MAEFRFRVIVIGGGIGGLCLVQGLRRAGIDVAVYERDLERMERLDGYRLHINPTGARALRESLPHVVWEAFVASAGKTSGGVGFLTERLRRLAVIEEQFMYGGKADPADQHYPVDRVTLRNLLLAGLDGTVDFGKKFERYEIAPDGTVTAHFSDGSAAEGDVLVGADGAGSRVRRQYLPHARRVHTDAVAVGLKLPLDQETKGWLPPRLAVGMNMIVAGDPRFLFTSVSERKHGWVENLEEIRDRGGISGLSPESLVDESQGYRDYLLCAFAARRDAYPSGVEELDGRGLRSVVEVMISGWHPRLRRVIAGCGPESAMLLPIEASVRPEAWETTNVTLLGDAIHSMPPIGGLGANTALRDAHLLGLKLSAADRGEMPLLTGIKDYETEMLEYGFEAVNEPLQNTRQAVSGNRFASATFKTVLRVCQAVPPLKRMLVPERAGRAA